MFPTATRSLTKTASRTPGLTPTMRRSPNATWARPDSPTPEKPSAALIGGLVGGIVGASLIIIIIGLIAIKRKPPEQDDVMEESMPYTD
jgi:predicted lipid-binding transport protein (Tim44 family)